MYDAHSWFQIHNPNDEKPHAPAKAFFPFLFMCSADSLTKQYIEAFSPIDWKN